MHRYVLVAFGLLSAFGVAGHARATHEVVILVFRENAVGATSQAQPYVDKLVSMAKKANGWPAARGKYITRRRRAEKFIKKASPQFGMISLGAFLAMSKPHQLKVLGSVDLLRAGGRRYHIVSKTVSTLKKCTTLASNHFRDPRFIDNVVSGGAFKLTDFQKLKTRRPVQTIKKLIRQKADCALINNALFAELAHIKGSAGIRSIWKSKMLPPMPIVAFARASAAQSAKFKASLSTICSADLKSDCGKMGVVALKPTSSAAYRAVLAAYYR